MSDDDDYSYGPEPCYLCGRERDTYFGLLCEECRRKCEDDEKAEAGRGRREAGMSETESELDAILSRKDMRTVSSGEIRLLFNTIHQLQAESERLRADLHHCRGLLETAVDAMSTNGIQCGLTQAWLDEAIRVIGWDDVDKEAGGDT